MVPFLEVVVLKSVEDSGWPPQSHVSVGWHDFHGRGKSLIRTATLFCLSTWTAVIRGGCQNVTSSIPIDRAWGVF